MSSKRWSDNVKNSVTQCGVQSTWLASTLCAAIRVRWIFLFMIIPYLLLSLHIPLFLSLFNFRCLTSSLTLCFSLFFLFLFFFLFFSHHYSHTYTLPCSPFSLHFYSLIFLFSSFLLSSSLFSEFLLSFSPFPFSLFDSFLLSETAGSWREHRACP